MFLLVTYEAADFDPAVDLYRVLYSHREESDVQQRFLHHAATHPRLAILHIRNGGTILMLPQRPVRQRFVADLRFTNNQLTLLSPGQYSLAPMIGEFNTNVTFQQDDVARLEILIDGDPEAFLERLNAQVHDLLGERRVSRLDLVAFSESLSLTLIPQFVLSDVDTATLLGLPVAIDGVAAY
jgi:hypothetical protein